MNDVKNLIGTVEVFGVRVGVDVRGPSLSLMLSMIELMSSRRLSRSSTMSGDGIGGGGGGGDINGGGGGVGVGGRGSGDGSCYNGAEVEGTFSNL